MTGLPLASAPRSLPYALLNATDAQKLSLFVLAWLSQLYEAYIALFAADEIRDLVSIHGKPVSVGGVAFLFLAAAMLFLLARTERRAVSGT